MNQMKIGAAALAVALTAVIVPTTVHAAEPLIVEGTADPQVVLVSYADLNLASAAGVGRLNSRVRGAANRLCIDSGVHQPLERSQPGRACRDEAVKGASEQIKFAVANFGKTKLAAASEPKIMVALR